MIAIFVKAMGDALFDDKAALQPLLDRCRKCDPAAVCRR